MDVRDVQAALLAAGFNPGAVDGKGGPATKAAIAAFQSAHGLKVDGVAGALTLSLLMPGLTTRPAGLLSEAIIRKVAPKARQDIIDAMVGRPDKFSAAGIVTPQRMTHFLSETATESGGFTALEENLRYSAKRLLKTFRKYFPTEASTAGFVGNPRAIANRVYGGRLGNTQPNDGWDFRGGGIMQNTGRFNYRKAGFEDNPEALRQPGPALDAALSFWVLNGLNELADRGPVAVVRKRINGGTNGLAEAEAYHVKARRALGI